MTQEKKDSIKKQVIKFIRHKIMLIVALVCEIAALLIKNGRIQADPQLVGSLTWAGIIIMLIWLVMDGLKNKYYRYGKKWGFLDEEGNPIKVENEVNVPDEGEKEEFTP